MYLKNNQKFLYVFIIATLAYHEQFLSDNQNNDEEEKIPEEIYYKGCCNCNIFTVNLPFTKKDLIDNFGPNNQKENLGDRLKTFLGLENKKKIDDILNNVEYSKLLELHELLNSNFDKKNNENLEEEKLEDYEKKNNKENIKINYKKAITIFENDLQQVSVLCKYKKEKGNVFCKYKRNFGILTYNSELDVEAKIIGRFIKINNRIPCLFFQTILHNSEFNIKQDKILIIFFHGLGDNIINYFGISKYNKNSKDFDKEEKKEINDLLKEGFDLAIIEYKGGGYYDGDFDEDDFRNNDARDIFNFFSKIYKNNEIITLGYSLGCALASQFTAKAEEIIKEKNINENKNENNNKINGCILIYPFINIKQAGKHIFETQGGWFGNHFSWLINPLLKLRFDNKKWVSKIHSQLLLVNNQNDIICNEKSIIPLKDAFFRKGEKIEEIAADDYIKTSLNLEYKTYMNNEKYLHIINSKSNDHFNINWEEIKTFLKFLRMQYHIFNSKKE